MQKVIHSHTSLDVHKKCPQQYYQVRVLKRFPYIQSPQAVRGEAIHKALELYAKSNIPMPTEFIKFGWAVDSIIKPAKGDKYYEYSFAFDAQGNKVDETDWTTKDFIGSADVLVVHNDKAMVVDYKTGSSLYPNPKQLERMAICTMLEFPDVNTVMGVLVFLDHDPTQLKGNQYVEKTYHRKDLLNMMAVLNSEKAAVARDLSSGFWEMKPSPLCPWCPVTDCPNYTPPKDKTK